MVRISASVQKADPFDNPLYFCIQGKLLRLAAIAGVAEELIQVISIVVA